MHCIGDLYHIPCDHRDRHGQVMILLEEKNGQGKFWTQGSHKIIWDQLNFVIKVNKNLPHYHGGDPEYWNKLHNKLDNKLGDVLP
jgi:hypothetical protein